MTRKSENVDLQAIIREHAAALAEQMRSRESFSGVVWKNADLRRLAEFAIEDAATHGVESSTTGQPPETLLELARRLGERDVPVSVMVEASMKSSEFLLELLLRVQSDPRIDLKESHAELHSAARQSMAAGRRMSTTLLAEFTNARESWARSTSGDLAAAVDSVLDPASDDSARLPAYPLHVTHVGLIAWTSKPMSGFASPLREAVSRWCAAVGARAHLILPRDSQTFEVWANAELPASELASAASRLIPDDALAAVAGPSAGTSGFRRVHEQLLATRTVAAISASPKRVTHFGEVAAIAALARDPNSASDWVFQTLGDLAGNNAEKQRLRETLRTHLALGDNASATASALFLHRNTVAYRLARARDLLPQAGEISSLDLALALEYHFRVLDTQP